jgi:hypothetical protein
MIGTDGDRDRTCRDPMRQVRTVDDDERIRMAARTAMWRRI